MSKRSEDAALKAYPVNMTPLNYQDLIEQFGGKTEIDVNTYPRCLFQAGYEQAEEDLDWISVKDRIRYIEKIRHEIEFLKELNEGLYTEGDNSYYEGHDNACNHILAFIDSLPEENLSYVTDSPGDPGHPGEPGISDLEEAAKEYSERFSGGHNYRDLTCGFIAGAEWQAKQLHKGSPLPEDTVLFQKGVEEGRRLEMDDLALTWEDIRRIVKIADDLLDAPKARVAFQNHNEEYYYKRVLDEYNKLHQTEAE